MPFNDKLKELRLRDKLTQEQLSIKLNIAKGTYLSYEKGKKYPPVELLFKMARLFKVSVSVLLDEQNEASADNTLIQELRYEKQRADQLIKDIKSLIDGDRLFEADKDGFIQALQDICRKAIKTHQQL